MNFNLVYLIPFIAAGAGLIYSHTSNQAATVHENTISAQTDSTPYFNRMTEVSTRDKQGRYSYNLDPKKITYSVTETSFLPHVNGMSGGLTAEMRYFEDRATQKFERKFKNSKQCPASFFNRNSKAKFLIATSPHVKSKLKSWKNQTWKNTDEWYKTELEGRCVTGASSYVVDGEEIVDRLPGRWFSNCKYFYVEKVVSRTPYLENDKRF